MKTTKEMIEVMEAYDNGAEIEFINRNITNDTFDLALYPLWNWRMYDYRIKEEPKEIKVFEWICKRPNTKRWCINDDLVSEEDAVGYFGDYKYKKTGRSFMVPKELR